MIADLIWDGLRDVYWLLSQPPISYFIGIVFATFVALRAFYIQKRHERMADKYEEAIRRIVALMHWIELEQAARSTFRPFIRIDPAPQKPAAPVPGNLNPAEELALFIRLSRVYLSPRAYETLIRFDLETRRPSKPGGDAKAADKEWKDQLNILLEQMLDHASQDLRPSLIHFAQEFIGIFWTG